MNSVCAKLNALTVSVALRIFHAYSDGNPCCELGTRSLHLYQFRAEGPKWYLFVLKLLCDALCEFSRLGVCKQPPRKQNCAYKNYLNSSALTMMLHPSRFDPQAH